ncbi:MAG: Crp/Fnr family transcriptional regulator [Betaproteobacteria bacterium]|nr:Crp/Fnr family transcriptional regulator [Betaproteobacteria bacterium]
MVVAQVPDWGKWGTANALLPRVPAALRRVARTRHFARGEILYRRGDRAADILCVLAGELRLTRASRTGTEVILQRVRDGFIAEASLESKAYHCDIVAADEGELLAFPIAAFRHALQHDATFHAAWSAQLAREVRRLRAQCERLSLNSAAERICHFIEADGDNGEVTIGQSRKSWAAELGISHEALYRALRRMQDEGALIVHGARMRMRMKP